VPEVGLLEGKARAADRLMMPDPDMARDTAVKLSIKDWSW
jgi:hypothetical protein